MLAGTKSPRRRLIIKEYFMKRSNILVIAILAVVAILGVALVSASSSKNNNHMSADMDKSKSVSNSKEAPKPNEVFIKDFAFGPAKMTIKKGTTITWTNKDSAHHDITPDKEDPGFVPSQLLAKDQSYSFTFNNVGTYKYHCSPHPYMKAIIEVTE